MTEYSLPGLAPEDKVVIARLDGVKVKNPAQAFRAFASALGKGKKNSFRGGNLRGLLLDQQDLRGFNLEGADLRDCSLVETLFDPMAIEAALLEGAIAEEGQVYGRDGLPKWTRRWKILEDQKRYDAIAEEAKALSERWVAESESEGDQRVIFAWQGRALLHTARHAEAVAAFSAAIRGSNPDTDAIDPIDLLAARMGHVAALRALGSDREATKELIETAKTVEDAPVTAGSRSLALRTELARGLVEAGEFVPGLRQYALIEGFLRQIYGPADPVFLRTRVEALEVRLKASEGGQTSAREQLTFEHLSDGVCLFDRAQRFVYANGAFAELWGLEPAWLAEHPTHAELLDRLRLRRRLPETEDFPSFKAAELARYEQLAASAEQIWRLPDERTLRVMSQPHPQGGLLMIFSDITPELRLKTLFNHQIQVQQATLDKLTDAVAVFGSDGRLKLHNEAFGRFWNISEAQLDDAADFDAVAELCVPRLHDMQFWRDLKARITDTDPRARAAVEDELVTADRRIVAYQSRPLPDGATLIGFADVTDTRRLEGALRDRESALAETERMKREFVGSVSDELRTPLTTIIGYSELLERGAEGLSDRARGHIAAVRAASTQLARSINDVLDMAEIDAGELALDVEDIDVGDLMADTVARWSHEAENARIALSIDEAESGGLIRGDTRRLSQVLDHLVENGLRHTPPGGSVRLSAQRALGEVRLQVSDTGRGIPFHVQAHIFGRSHDRDSPSWGLGLTLVKSLVELHGGWMALESEPGKGSTFTCHLPESPLVPRPDLF